MFQPGPYFADGFCLWDLFYSGILFEVSCFMFLFAAGSLKQILVVVYVNREMGILCYVEYGCYVYSE